MAVVIVDGENVRRSLWPNMSRDELEARANAWAGREGHDVRVVWDADSPRGYADDEIVRLAAELEPPVWVVTSDRGLRERLDVERTLGGGSFARTI
jgi:hypothetical protein